jgi:hypothetical protein
MNNKRIYDGALAGAFAGAMLGRVPYSSIITSYDALATVCVAYATAIDAAIVPTGDEGSVEQEQLIFALSIAYWKERLSYEPTPTAILSAIVAEYTNLNARLQVVPIGGGGGGGGIEQRLLIVSKNGSDDTGDGSWGKPYLTIQKCMNVVAARGDASSTIRYVALVLPGDYDEDIYFEPWVFVHGINQTHAVRIAATITALSATWILDTDHEGGISNCTLRNALTIDFNALNSTRGKFYIENCIFIQQPVFTAYSALNQVGVKNSDFMSGLLQIGCNLVVTACSFRNGGPYRMMSHPTVTTSANLLACGSDGELQMSRTEGDALVISDLRATSFGSYRLAGFIAINSNPPIYTDVTTFDGATNPLLELTGSRDGNAALASVCTALASAGIAIDSTVP